MNGQDGLLSLNKAEGRAYTVLASRVGSDGTVYCQTAEFPAYTWPKADGKEVSMSDTITIMGVETI